MRHDQDFDALLAQRIFRYYLWAMAGLIVMFIMLYAAATRGEDLASAQKRAESGGDAMVVVISQPGCTWCGKQLAEMDANGIAYVHLEAPTEDFPAAKFPTTHIRRKPNGKWRYYTLDGYQPLAGLRERIMLVNAVPKPVEEKPVPEAVVAEGPLPPPPLKVGSIKGDDHGVVVVKGESWLLLTDDEWIVAREFALSSGSFSVAHKCWYSPSRKLVFLDGAWKGK